jgi:hypothetical protein
MFFSKRKKATQTALEAIRPMLSVLFHFRDEPDGFWSDPFVLGYVSALASFFAKASTNGKIETTDLGHVLSDVLSELSRESPNVLVPRYLGYVNSENADFLKGMDNALKTVSFTYGRLPNEETDNDVQMAKEIAKGNSFGRPVAREDVGGSLQFLLFNNEVRKRFFAE